jgi:myo-inositol-1(or 4)-monophosphatase
LSDGGFAWLADPLEATLRSTRPTVLHAFGRRRDAPHFKEDGSAVTETDLRLEAQITEAVLGLDGRWGLVSEEAGRVRAGRPTWHLDPLDGTANFARRIGVFASQIALVDGTVPLFAAVYEPLTDRFTWAARGAGTWHERERVAMPVRPPEEAILDLDVPRRGVVQDCPGLLAAARRRCYKVRALGSIAIHLRDVAVGAADGFLGTRTTATPLHDLAPGALLVREAGGVVSDGRGGDPLRARTTFLAGAPPVHDWLCALLREHVGA